MDQSWTNSVLKDFSFADTIKILGIYYPGSRYTFTEILASRETFMLLQHTYQLCTYHVEEKL